MPRHMGGETFELVLVATPDDHAPPIIRLRHVLKALIRTYNFRAVSVRDVTPKLPPAAPTAAQETAEDAEATASPPTPPDAS